MFVEIGSNVLVKIVLIFALFFYDSSAKEINLPAVPCPNVFKYEFDGNNYAGILTLRNLSFGQTTIQVKMEYPGNCKNQDFSGALLLDTKKDEISEHIISGKPIAFRAVIPHQNIVPQVTDITINDSEICTISNNNSVPFGLSRSTLVFKRILIVNEKPSEKSKEILKPEMNSKTKARPKKRFVRSIGNPFLSNAMNGIHTNYNSFSIERNPFLRDAATGFSNPFISKPFFEFNHPQYDPSPRYQPSLQPERTPRAEQYTKENPFLSGTMSRQQYSPPQIAPRIDSNPPKQENPFLAGTMTNRYSPPPQTQPPPPVIEPRNSNPAPSNPFLEHARSGSREPLVPSPTFAPSWPSAKRDQFLSLDSICGRENKFDVRGLIANGQPMSRSRFPWLVAIQKLTEEKTIFKCGGSLISHKTVISAAHCFKEGIDTIEKSHILISLGVHNRSDQYNVLNVGVETLIIHDDFQKVPDVLDADLAIVILKDRIRFTMAISPICLWQGPESDAIVAGAIGNIAGWGEGAPRRGLSEVPRVVTATIVSELECIRSNNQLFYLTSNRTLCAGNKDGSGPCNGDSGSALMMLIGERWMLRAIVSSALSTAANECDLNEYVIFTDIAKFIVWIKENMVL